MNNLLNNCVICEAHKHRDECDHHACPFEDKSCVGKFMLRWKGMIMKEFELIDVEECDDYDILSYRETHA